MNTVVTGFMEITVSSYPAALQNPRFIPNMLRKYISRITQRKLLTPQLMYLVFVQTGLGSHYKEEENSLLSCSMTFNTLRAWEIQVLYIINTQP